MVGCCNELSSGEEEFASSDRRLRFCWSEACRSKASVACSLEEEAQQSLRKRQEEDEDHQQEAEHTLHLLRMLSGARANAALVEQVAAFNTATTTAQHRHAQKQTHEPKSCFSEKDFEEFEREHFLGELV